MLDRARELAEIVGADAITLADLNNFRPEDGMILANTTSIGMQPKVDETPISKVCMCTVSFSYFGRSDSSMQVYELMLCDVILKTYFFIQNIENMACMLCS